MGRQAHHHFIPSSYLKGFTLGGEDTSKFWGIPVNNDSPFPTKPKDACSKRDYYTTEHENPLFVEHWYANEIEPKINVALRHIIEFSELPKKNEFDNLALLLATLYLRCPSFRSQIEGPLNHVKKVAESMAEDIKITNLHEFEYTQTDLIKHELKLIDKVVKNLSGKYYQLYVTDSLDCEVITSDNPFILYHPNRRKDFYCGLNTSNIEIWVPITRKAILVAKNEKIKEGVFLADERLIGLTNTRLIKSASRFFFSPTPEITLVDDDLNVYKYKISSNNGN